MAESAPQVTSAPPLVIISYSNEDEKWKDQLVSLFPTNIDLELRLHRVEDEPQSASYLVNQLTRIDEGLAKVLVVLLSASYLRGSWILTEQAAAVLELERQYGLKILPVLLYDCPVDDIPFLRNRYVVVREGKPIADTSPTEQARALRNLTFQILDAAAVAKTPAQKASEQTPSPRPPETLAGPAKPPAQKSSKQTPPASRLSETVPAKVLEKFTWTTEVEKILDGARALGLDKDGRTTISALSILFAFAEAGRLQPSDTKTPQFLWGEITRRGVTVYENGFKFAFPSVRTRRSQKGTTRPSFRLTRDAVELLELATSLSLQTIKLQPPAPNVPPPLSSGYIAARHLLAAMMLGPENTSSMLTTITHLEGLRRRFFKILEKSDLPDDWNEWRSILQIDATKPESTTAEHPLSSPETEAELMGKGEPPPIEEEVEAEAEEFLKPILAGFATDHWIGKDLLNIEGDVNALASLVSAWSVEPPLSIGLFGDWGSGKSHFMRQCGSKLKSSHVPRASRRKSRTRSATTKTSSKSNSTRGTTSKETSGPALSITSLQISG